MTDAEIDAHFRRKHGLFGFFALPGQLWLWAVGRLLGAVEINTVVTFQVVVPKKRDDA